MSLQLHEAAQIAEIRGDHEDARDAGRAGDETTLIPRRFPVLTRTLGIQWELDR